MVHKVVELRTLVLSDFDFNITNNRLRVLSFIVLRLSFSRLVIESNCLSLGHRSLLWIGLDVGVLDRRDPNFTGDRSPLPLQLLALGDLFWFHTNCRLTFLSSFGTLLLLGCQLFATIAWFWSNRHCLWQILTGKDLLGGRIPCHLLVFFILRGWCPFLLSDIFQVDQNVVHLFFVPYWLLHVWAHTLRIQHHSLLRVILLHIFLNLELILKKIIKIF